MTFEEYLITKKIDHQVFQQTEPQLYGNWKEEFGQMHPNSFTIQKLNLINPIRRKYQLKQEVIASEKQTVISEEKIADIQKPQEVSTPKEINEEPKLPGDEQKPLTAPKPARPVFKPKPKM